MGQEHTSKDDDGRGGVNCSNSVEDQRPFTKLSEINLTSGQVMRTVIFDDWHVSSTRIRNA